MRTPTLTIFIVFVISTNSLAQVRFEATANTEAGLDNLFVFDYQVAKMDSLIADSFKVTVYSTHFKGNVLQEIWIVNTLTRTLEKADSGRFESYYVNRTRKSESQTDTLLVSLFGVKNQEEIKYTDFSIIKPLPVRKAEAGKKTVTLHGQIRSETYLSDGYFDYQSVPLNYTRTSVDMQLNLGDLPFRTGFLYTTESADINSFYFSFDYNTYKSNLIKRLNEDRARKAALGLGQDKKIQDQLAQIDKDRFEIDNEIRNVAYTKKLAAYKKDLEYASVDSSFKHTRRYKRAALFTETDSLKRVRYAGLGQLKEKLNTAQLQQHPQLYKRGILTDDKKLRGAYKDADINEPAFGLFNSVRRFDIGTFSPRYNVLMMDGVQVTGINLELNKGLTYLAVCAGETRTAMAGYGSYNRYSSTFSAVRVGIRSDKKLSFIISGLRGNGKSGTLISEAVTLPLANQVIGGEFSYAILPNLVVRAEYAQSTQSNEPTGAYHIGILTAQRKEAFGFSGAWLFGTSYAAKDAKTQVEFTYQQTGPGYYSLAAPYLRRDNRKTELKLNRKLYKNVWSAFASSRVDYDNLYDTKSASTSTVWLTLGTKITPRKLPYIVASISPLWQHTTSRVQQITITNRVNLYNVLIGYNYFGEKVTNTSTFNYVKNSTYALLNNEVNNQGFIMDAMMLNNIIQYKPYEISVSTGIRNLKNVVSLNNTDSAAMNSVGYDIMVTKRSTKIKSSVEAGYAYIEGAQSMFRHVYKAGVSTVLGSSFILNLRGEKHNIYQPAGYAAIHVFRATLIKKF